MIIFPPLMNTGFLVFIVFCSGFVLLDYITFRKCLQKFSFSVLVFDLSWDERYTWTFPYFPYPF